MILKESENYQTFIMPNSIFTHLAVVPYIPLIARVKYNLCDRLSLRSYTLRNFRTLLLIFELLLQCIPAYRYHFLSL